MPELMPARTITPEIVDRMQSLYDQHAMMGQQPDWEVPQAGADASEYLTNLYYRDPTLAIGLAESAGFGRDEFLGNVRRVDQAAQARRASGFNPLQRTLYEIGEETEPLAKIALVVGTAIAGGVAAFGAGGAGGAGAASTAGAETLTPITLSSSTVPLDLAGAAMPAAGSFGPLTSSGVLLPSGATIAASQVPAANAAARAAAPAAAASATSPAAPPSPPTVPTPPPGGLEQTFFQRVGGFLEKNLDLIGSVLAGWGQAEANKDYLRERQELISQNYGNADPGRGYRAFTPNTQRTSPAERFGPSSAGGETLAGKMARELMPGARA